MTKRCALEERNTLETKIRCAIDLDGAGKTRLESGSAFFDHMLNAFARHGLFDLELSCQGDLDVDGHHSVEDCGIVLGKAIAKALGDKRGIRRVGSCALPMDESLAFCALDVSARPYLAFAADFPTERCGGFDTELAKEFFRAVAVNAGLTLHLRVQGENSHHMLEALFKAFGRALREGVSLDERVQGVPSTKGVL